MAHATTMEDVNGQLEKAINDFKEAISDGMSPAGRERLNTLVNTVHYASSFYQNNIKVFADENAELAQLNRDLKATVKLIVNGITDLKIANDNENGEAVQLKQDNDKMKAAIEDLSKQLDDLMKVCESKEAEKEKMAEKIKDLEARASTSGAGLKSKIIFDQSKSSPSMAPNALQVQLDEKNKTIAALEEETRQLKSEKAHREKHVTVLQKMVDDQGKYIERLERSGNAGTRIKKSGPSSVASTELEAPSSSFMNANAKHDGIHVGLPTRRTDEVHLDEQDVIACLPGDPSQYILLKDATIGAELNYNLLYRKVLVVKRLVSTDDAMIWEAYSTLDDIHEKPIRIKTNNASFKLHLNGSLTIHKKQSKDLFSMIQSCSLSDLRLYYITISYQQFKKLVCSGTITTFYSIFVVVQNERLQDLQIQEIIREVSNAEAFSFVFPRNTQVTPNNFSQLPYLPNLKKFTFGNIPETIDRSALDEFLKKYPNAACRFNFLNDSTTSSNNNYSTH